MDVEHKKTVLDDDSPLYQKRDESFRKKDTSSMSFSGKLGYFRDYYLKGVLIAIAVVLVVSALIYTVFFRRQETSLSVGFLNGAQIAGVEDLNLHLRDFYGLTSENDIVDISNYDLEDYASQIRFSTYSAAQTMDVLVCDQETFENYAARGFFADLSEYLPSDLYEKAKGQLVNASEVLTDDAGNVTETLPAAPRGIDITGNALYMEYGGQKHTIILAVLDNSKRAENAAAFIDHLLSSGESAQAE